MGNKQTTFTDEQLEAYQVTLHGSYNNGDRVLLYKVCLFCVRGSTGQQSVQGVSPAADWLSSSLSASSHCLSVCPQDCTFFTRKEVLR